MMKKIQVLAFMALILMFGCSNEELINTKQDSVVSEESNLSVFNGERKSNPNAGVNTIAFLSNSDVELGFYDGCLPTGLNLLKYGNFSGTLSGFGKIKTSLSTYEIISCVENFDYPLYPNQVYSIVAQGVIALGTRDYCYITITGKFDIGDDTSYGFVYGVFVGNATTYSGVGKLKGLNNKSFEVYNGKVNGPSLNLNEGTITLRFSDY